MLNKTQKYLMEAMVLAGESEEAAYEKVKGYKGSPNKSNKDGSLKCPRCSSTMTIAQLSEGRRVKYCTNDRVCLPFKET